MGQRHYLYTYNGRLFIPFTGYRCLFAEKEKPSWQILLFFSLVSSYKNSPITKNVESGNFVAGIQPSISCFWLFYGISNKSTLSTLKKGEISFFWLYLITKINQPLWQSIKFVATQMPRVFSLVQSTGSRSIKSFKFIKKKAACRNGIKDIEKYAYSMQIKKPLTISHRKWLIFRASCRDRTNDLLITSQLLYQLS